MLTLESPHRFRERIMAFGGPGVGKSRAFQSIAAKCPNVTFHILDIDWDLTHERFLATEFEGVGNVVVYEFTPDQIMPVIAAIEKISASSGPNDWLGVDSFTHMWDAAQRYFTEQVFGKDKSSYFLDMRKRNKSGEAKFDGWRDWPQIKDIFYDVQRAMRKFPGHTYVTAEQQAMSDMEDKANKITFGSLGVRPSGQKAIGHAPKTVLHMSKRRMGDYLMTTVKDVGREEVENREVTDFAKDYLVPIAGWKRKKVG
jgi:hypothetical protein